MSSETTESGVPALRAAERGSEGARRKWLGLSAVLLLAGLGAGVVLAVRLIADPPAPVCTLPGLALPKARQLVWSPDSRNLLVRGEDDSLWQVRFPELSAKRLPGFRRPSFAQPLGWDAAGRPLVFVGRWGHGRLHRLPRSGDRWEPTRVTGIRVDVSPDGRRAAVRESKAMERFARNPSLDSVPLSTVDRVMVVNLDTLAEEASMPQPSGSTVDLRWVDSRTLGITRSTPGQPLWARGAPWWKHTASSGRFERVTGPAPLGPPRLWALRQDQPAPFARERALLRRLDVPGIPHSDPQHAWLLVRDGTGRELRRVPLGRVPASQQGRGGSPREVSPDGRWVVTNAGDGSVRVLDLHAAPAR